MPHTPQFYVSLAPLSSLEELRLTMNTHQMPTIQQKLSLLRTLPRLWEFEVAWWIRYIKLARRWTRVKLAEEVASEVKAQMQPPTKRPKVIHCVHSSLF